jgi:hypothetical protein
MVRMREAAEAVTAEARWLVRAAVLSVFDLDWLEPEVLRPRGVDADQLAGFLADSCERVVDTQGVSRWRLRDDRRLRVLRTVSREELLAAVEAAPRRPDEPVQHVLERYLHGTLQPVEALGAAELTAVLQLERWMGAGAGLPTEPEIASRLDWLNLLAPLRRLLGNGFVGRDDVLAGLAAYVDATSAQPPFIIEGVGGSGKSTVLARLIETTTARGMLVCYASFDRSWLVQGGAWSLIDEIARQAGMQLSTALNGQPERVAKLHGEVTELRRQIQRFARRKGYSDIASRDTQQHEPVPRPLLEDLGRIISGRRLVLVLDTLEELARRDVSLAKACSLFLRDLAEALPGLRVVAAGRARPRFEFSAGRIWQLSGLSGHDGVRLLRQQTGITGDDDLLVRIVHMTRGNPLSLHLAADVLRRTGTDPTRLIAIGQGDIQGQLYSRLLEHIKDTRARAVAHPGLVVRRITPDIIRKVLAEPCGIAPLSEQSAMAVFSALESEATLCEPSTDGDGALVHRPDVRALMLPAITRALPGAARAIHEAAVRYYEQLAPRQRTTDHVARREELYHRLMLNQPGPELDRRWLPSAADELAAAMDEMPPQAQLYLAEQVKGVRLDPEVRAQADEEQWQRSVRPRVESLLEYGQFRDALKLLRERRGHDGRALLPDLEIEVLERLGRTRRALKLAETEQKRATRLGQDARLRDLILQQARILERGRRFDQAWELLDGLAELDRTAGERKGVLDEEARARELVLLTSLLRIARHSAQDDDVVRQVRAETLELAEGTPARMLLARPSLLRDLAAEIGDLSPQIIDLATTVRGVDPTTRPKTPTTPSGQFVRDTDDSQRYQTLYWRSLRLTRVAIGILGFGLPVVLQLSSESKIPGIGVTSEPLSAYYRTGARDLFVGFLCTIAVLLITYKLLHRTWDARLSTVAGVAALGIALLPIGGTPPLTPLQDRLGEQAVSVAHLVCEAIFALSLSAISFLFGADGVSPAGVRHRLHWRALQWTAGTIMTGVVLYIAATAVLGRSQRLSLHTGEEAAMFAFGLSWILKGISPATAMDETAASPAADPTTVSSQQFVRVAAGSSYLDRMYLRSLLLSRAVIGILCLGLPVVLLLGDGLLGDHAPRESLSGYYHTGMRDVFVGTLWMIGVLLLLYRPFAHTLDSVLTVIAGTAALGVALFPTVGPSDSPSPATPIQLHLGVHLVATVHYVCAVVFILAVGLISLFFGVREGRRPQERGDARARFSPTFWRRFHFGCAGAIGFAVGFVGVSQLTGWLSGHSLFIAETTAIVAFGLSWLVKGLEPNILLDRAAPETRSVATVTQDQDNTQPVA